MMNHVTIEKKTKHLHFKPRLYKTNVWEFEVFFISKEWRFPFVELNMLTFTQQPATFLKNKPRSVNKCLGLPFCDGAEARRAPLAG